MSNQRPRKSSRRLNRHARLESVPGNPLDEEHRSTRRNETTPSLPRRQQTLCAREPGVAAHPPWSAAKPEPAGKKSGTWRMIMPTTFEPASTDARTGLQERRDPRVIRTCAFRSLMSSLGGATTSFVGTARHPRLKDEQRQKRAVERRAMDGSGVPEMSSGVELPASPSPSRGLPSSIQSGHDPAQDCPKAAQGCNAASGTGARSRARPVLPTRPRALPRHRQNGHCASTGRVERQTARPCSPGQPTFAHKRPEAVNHGSRANPVLRGQRSTM